MPRDESMDLKSNVEKDGDYLRATWMMLKEYDSSFKAECACKKSGEFKKNAFNFMKPMTAFDKMRVYKDYGKRF